MRFIPKSMYNRVYLGIICCAILTGCTLNMINTNSEGTATDTVDASPNNDVKVDATVPIKTL